VSRDSRWFDDLFSRHGQAVHRFFRRRTARADVDDLTADVFVVVWRRRDQVPAGAELAWLYRTAGFVLANHRRKLTPLPLHDVSVSVDAVSQIQWSADSADIRAVLDRLSPKDRQILLLAGWEGLAGEELAAVLGISRGAADTALSRARARLRDAWTRVDSATG
jgi:RNA polymerase sigma factor (sigma-70 family)